MVIDAILSLLSSIVAGFFSLMPHLAVPSWLDQAGAALSTVTGALTGTSSWLPWSVLEAGVALSLASVGISVAIRGIRIVLSFLTLGGGA